VGGKGQKHDCFDCRLISLQLNIVITKELQSNFSSAVLENICVDYFLKNNILPVVEKFVRR